MTAADKEVMGMHNEATFRVPVGQRQLFLDDYGFAKIEHLTRTMYQPGARSRGRQVQSAL